MKQILKVTILSGLYTFLKMLAGFIIGKVIALYTGPSGMAMMGQIQSVVTVLNGLATAPAGNGLVRYTAENHEQGINACVPWWRACVRVSILIILIVIPIFMVFSQKISYYLFENAQYYWLIILACGLIPCSIVNTLVASVLNGQQRYREYITLGMLSVIASTVVMIILIVFYGLKGALIATACNNAIAGIVLYFCCRKEVWLRLTYWFGNVEKEKLAGITKYTLMALTTAIAMPLALLFVRNILITEQNWDQAGQWQAVWKISEVYLSVITVALSTYFLPRLAVIRDGVMMKKEVNSILIYIMSLAAVMALGIYIFRDVIITVLFTEEFRSARNLFLYQLIGDVIKVAGFTYAYPILAQGKMKIYISSEIIFSVSFVLLVQYFVKNQGIQGANIGYLINYSLYLLFTFVYTNFINSQSLVKKRGDSL